MVRMNLNGNGNLETLPAFAQKASAGDEGEKP
jgi:hypothetical protein